MLHREPTPPRRLRSASGLVLLGGLAALAATVYARYVEPNTLLVRSYNLDIPTLPPALDGVKIAFLSDFHIGGPGSSTETTRQAIRRVEEERPDLILLGGDYYDDGHRVTPDPDWARFPKIAPTLAVFGNHDYYFGPEATAGIRQELEDSGITILCNEARSVLVGEHRIGIVGVDDAFIDRADFDAANRDIEAGIHPRILITHAGLLVDELPTGSVDLILSGHTHGGQVRVSPFRHTSPLDPFWWLDVIMGKKLSPYRQGMFYVNGVLLYVANGIGTTTAGIRFLAPPEVTLFTLRSGTGNREHRCDKPERYIRAMDTEWRYKPYEG